jgi:hypothetical protein
MQLDGMHNGCVAGGQPDCVQLVTRVIVLANAPADLEDFLYIILGCGVVSGAVSLSV